MNFYLPGVSKCWALFFRDSLPVLLSGHIDPLTTLLFLVDDPVWPATFDPTGISRPQLVEYSLLKAIFLPLLRLSHSKTIPLLPLHLKDLLKLRPLKITRSHPLTLLLLIYLLLLKTRLQNFIWKTLILLPFQLKISVFWDLIFDWEEGGRREGTCIADCEGGGEGSA